MVLHSRARTEPFWGLFAHSSRWLAKQSCYRQHEDPEGEPTSHPFMLFEHGVHWHRTSWDRTSCGTARTLPAYAASGPRNLRGRQEDSAGTELTAFSTGLPVEQNASRNVPSLHQWSTCEKSSQTPHHHGHAHDVTQEVHDQQAPAGSPHDAWGG